MTPEENDARIRARVADVRGRLDAKTSPTASFTRGMVVGGSGLQALQLLTPDLLCVHEWPIWLRAIVGVLFLAVTVNYVMAQRGLMTARARTR